VSGRRWFVDIWDDDDPAIVRGREAMTLRPTEEPTRQDDAGEAPDATTRRERIAALVHRIEIGDLSAVATLRELLGGR
jgi:hypothetical protein